MGILVFFIYIPETITTNIKYLYKQIDGVSPVYVFSFGYGVWENIYITTKGKYIGLL